MSVRLIFILILFYSGFANTANQPINAPINILFLMTYSPTVPWTKSVTDSVTKHVRESEYPINIYIEYMHALPLDNETDLQATQALLAQKYKNIKIDGIYTESVSSFNLAQRISLNRTHKDTPQIILEVNQDYQVQPHTFVTRSLEAEMITLNLQLMLEQNPSMKTIYIIDGFGMEFDTYFFHLQQAVNQLAPHIAFEFIEFVNISGLQKTLDALPKGNVIAYLPVFHKENNLIYVPIQLLENISEASSLPIYTFWTSLLQAGTVGGNMLDSELLGKMIVENFIQKLTTGRWNDSPQIANWHFDYAQLERFDLHIPESISPQSIINTPRNIIDDYPLESLGIIFTFIALLIAFIIKRQHFLAQALHASNLSEQKAKSDLDKIEALSKAKSQFLASVSHEIRTPINGIHGAINLINQEPLTDQQQRFVSIIDYCADNLLYTVNDILDFSKLENHSLKIVPTNFSAAKLLDDSFAYATLTKGEKDITIVKVDKHLIDVPLYGDIRRLQQIANNLINNAVKFTPKGEISIGAKVTFTQNMFQLVFWVTDTGVGIAQEDKRALFMPFTQAYTFLAQPEQGSGLGLSICKELIELMGGKIELESQLGEGTSVRVCVTLPSGDNDSIEPESNISTVRVSCCHLLVVEDNAINREILVHQLTAQGFKVTTVENGQECLDMLKSSPTEYDAVIMDLRMPVMSGDIAAQHIRSGNVDARYTNIPIIALSAHIDIEDGPEINLDLFTEKLTKPVTPDELVLCIHKACRLH